MKKIFLSILFALILQYSFAQLGALKAKKDAATTKIADESSENTVGFEKPKDLESDFANNVFILKDYSVEDVSDALTKAVLVEKQGKIFDNTKWNFILGKKLRMSFVKSDMGKEELKFTINDNNVTFEKDGEKFQGEFLAKGNKYRFAAQVSGSRGTQVFLFEAKEKIGRDRYTKEELEKFTMGFQAKNGDFHYSENREISGGWFYNQKMNNVLDLYKVDFKSVSFDYIEYSKLELWEIDMNSIDINNFKVVYLDDWDAFVQIPLKIKTPKSTYTLGELSSSEVTEKIFIPMGSFNASSADGSLEFLAKNFSGAQLAAFKANTPKRKADLAARVQAEKIEEARLAKERIEARKHLASITIRKPNLYGKYEVVEKPLPNAKCSYETYELNTNKRYTTITMCVGSEFIEKSTGRVLFIVTKAMDGTEVTL